VIGLKIVLWPTTPWELLNIILEFGMEQPNKVQQLLLPVACWVFSAAIKGAQPVASSMLFSFNMITRPSKCLMWRIEAKLTDTLGRPEVQQPMYQPPLFGSPVYVQLAAQDAVASMLAVRPVIAHTSNIYERSINHAMRLLTDIKGRDRDYQRFSCTQRATIMSLCGVDAWKNVPTI